jgi:hypothetical protein
MVSSPFPLELKPQAVPPHYFRWSCYPHPPLHSLECPQSLPSLLLPLISISTLPPVLIPNKRTLTGADLKMSHLDARSFRVSSTRAARCPTPCYMTTSLPRSESQGQLQKPVERLSYDCSELYSYELMRELTGNASPSLLPTPVSSPVRNALDLASGDGHWVAHAAQVWGATTKITGIHIPLSTEEEPTTLPGRDTENVTFLRHNLYVYTDYLDHTLDSR